MSIFEVQHQERAHRIIQQALTSKRMPHSYLFAGPEGVGREMLAVRLARLLLCPSPVRIQSEPEASATGFANAGLDACGQCVDCQLAIAGTHPDLYIIHRQLNRQHPDTTVRKQKALQLGVDVIRHFVIDKVALYPNRGRAKVFIIREAERLTEAAQNSLLKTLEEPPAGTFLILITEAADRMLNTIRSRSQQVQFQALPPEFVVRKLAELRPEAPEAERAYIARHTRGSLGEALRMIDDGLYAIKIGWGERLMELTRAGRGYSPHELSAPLAADAKSLAKFIVDRDPDVSDTDATRTGLKQLFAVMGDFFADALHAAAGSDTRQWINTDQEPIIQTLAAGRSTDAFVRAIQTIHRADSNIDRNANVELTLETLFIELAHRLQAGAAPVRR